ncbi:CoA-binding protein [Halovenus rubra]|uniref:CoA-binding protein n=2 Tax=Halovenus rubra TaxID=869890 RepID=A0ABD5X0T8_9EURY|nr:CoA-binding protein [Halovenus rubra]
MRVETASDIRTLLEVETIAVVGCSSTPGKEAHEIPKHMLEKGYTIIPVNPFADRILGREAADSLGEVAEEIEMVNVFRPSEEVPEIVDDVLNRHTTRGDIESLWLQLGIRDDDATERAVTAGIDVVQDRCLKVEQQRLL